jgi:hypothetical protein
MALAEKRRGLSGLYWGLIIFWENMSRLFLAGLQCNKRSRLCRIRYSASLSAAAYLGASAHMKRGEEYTLDTRV